MVHIRLRSGRGYTLIDADRRLANGNWTGNESQTLCSFNPHSDGAGGTSAGRPEARSAGEMVAGADTDASFSACEHVG